MGIWLRAKDWGEKSAFQKYNFSFKIVFCYTGLALWVRKTAVLVLLFTNILYLLITVWGVVAVTQSWDGRGRNAPDKQKVICVKGFLPCIPSPPASRCFCFISSLCKSVPIDNGQVMAKLTIIIPLLFIFLTQHCTKCTEMTNLLVSKELTGSCVHYLYVSVSSISTIADEIKQLQGNHFCECKVILWTWSLRLLPQFRTWRVVGMKVFVVSCMQSFEATVPFWKYYANSSDMHIKCKILNMNTLSLDNPLQIFCWVV